MDINKLVETSKKVFHDSLQPNNALVAAPVNQSYYPKEAASYFLVWPGRDNGFNLAAMLLVGEDHYHQVLRWIWDRAEDFQSSEDKNHEGLLFRNYHVHGRIDLHYLQPDQNGTLLWSLGFKHELTNKSLTDLELKVLKKAADALMRIWDKDHFTLATEDLWEERGVQPKEGVLTYSLAACATGLQAAAKLTNHKTYATTSEQMTAVLLKHRYDKQEGHIVRRFGGSLGDDNAIDASLSGLVWPFNIGFGKAHLQKTADSIERNLLSDQGIHRYPDDTYEGSIGSWHNHKNHNAGAWPLLTHWLSIAYHELGDDKKANKYFELVLDNLDDDYIPEQFFCCHAVPWTGIKPLFWSHSMALIAAWKLGKINFRRRDSGIAPVY
jgi:GH15 family glucan-1,4-alpha-glucosidase